jgi:hypothetical protein
MHLGSSSLPLKSAVQRRGAHTTRFFRRVGIDDTEVPNSVRASLWDAIHVLGTVFPPVKLAGYCQRSLRDRRWVSASATGLGPGGTSDNSPAFPTPGRLRDDGTASWRDA